MSRADFITLVMRGAGQHASDTQPSFTDVPADAYYAAAVAQASKLGIVQGSGGKFRPQAPISREEAAVILAKASGLYGKMQGGSAKANFADLDQVSTWAQEAVERVNGLGLMTGKGNLRFDPKGNVTRAEMAKMVYMLMNH